MALNLGNAFVGSLLPKNLAGGFVERINLPRVFGVVFHWRDVTEEPEASLIFARADGGHDKNLVAPNDWTRVRKTRNRSFPTDVLRSCSVKLRGLRESFSNTGRTWTTELWPV